jgi:hypothetical protein
MIHLAATLACLFLLFTPGITGYAQELRNADGKYSQATPPYKQTPRSYFPGLGEFMARIQATHAKLWLAGEALNWDLADYELGEMKEVFSDVQNFVPGIKTFPSAI